MTLPRGPICKQMPSTIQRFGSCSNNKALQSSKPCMKSYCRINLNQSIPCFLRQGNRMMNSGSNKYDGVAGTRMNYFE